MSELISPGSVVQVADPNDRAHHSIRWVQVCWDDADLRRSYAPRIWHILRCKALSYRTSIIAVDIAESTATFGIGPWIRASNVRSGRC